MYTYAENQVQILKLTQNSIMEAMAQYLHSPKWGDPHEYDFVIHKDGQGLETRYQVTVNPKEPLDEEIVLMYQNVQVDLTAYFRGEGPFKSAENTG